MEYDDDDSQFEVTSNLEKKRIRRIWKNEWSVILCREILFDRPYAQKKGSAESKNIWESIYIKMSTLPDFDFDLKAMRDHFNGIREKMKPELRKDVNTTGEGSDTRSELQILLDELNEDIEKEAELQFNQTEEKRNANEIEKAKATEIRKKAMESLKETKKRKSENAENEDLTSPSSSKRRSGAETMRYLQERTDQLQKAKEEEAKLKKEELELRKSEIQNMQANFQTMAQTMHDSQQDMMRRLTYQQQQQSQQQMQQVMLQQAQMFSQIFEKMNK